MKNDNRYIDEKLYTMDKYIESFRLLHGHKFENEYTATEVKDITGITRQPLRILQDESRGIVAPKCEVTGSKRLYLFSEEELSAICVAKIANSFGYSYDGKENAEGKDPSILKIFSDHNNNLSEIAEYIFKSKGIDADRDHMINSEFIRSFGEVDPRYAALMYQKLKFPMISIYYEGEDTPDDRAPLSKAEDILELDDFKAFVKSLPVFKAIQENDPEYARDLISRLQKLVKEAYPNDKISSTMQYLSALDTKSDDSDYESYKLIYDMGGFERYKNLTEYIAFWELGQLSKELSKGILEDKVIEYNAYIMRRLAKKYENIVFWREDSVFAQSLDTICGKGTFNKFRTVRLYIAIDIIYGTLTSLKATFEDFVTIWENGLCNWYSVGSELYNYFKNDVNDDGEDRLTLFAKNINYFLNNADERTGITEENRSYYVQLCHTLSKILQSDYSEKDFVELEKMYAHKKQTPPADMLKAMVNYLQIDEAQVKALEERRNNITPEQILKAVSQVYGKPVEDMISSKNNPALTEARAVYMYLCEEYAIASVDDIGKAIGNRNQATVIYNVGMVKKQVFTDAELISKIEEIRNILTHGDDSYRIRSTVKIANPLL